MMPLTPGARIDELRRVLGESEQRRQAAEIKLADRERGLGCARQMIAALDHRIGWLTAEVARLCGAAASSVLDDYVRDATRFFSVYGTGSARWFPSPMPPATTTAMTTPKSPLLQHHRY